MITVPDRIGDAISAMERGEQVDWGKLHDLQALDLVRAGQQFVDEALASDAAADDAMKAAIEGLL